jgi:hypothetical protein
MTSDSRLAQLDENQLVTRINELQDKLQELKNRQFIGGDSWEFFRIVTGKSADISVTLAAAAVAVFRISYVPDNPAKLCAVNYRLLETFDIGFRLQPIPTSGANNSWDLRYTGSGPGTTHYSAQIIMESTQHGSILVQRLV